MRTRAARSHHPPAAALMVEVGDLFAPHEVVRQRGPAPPGFQRVLVVGDQHACVLVVGDQHACDEDVATRLIDALARHRQFERATDPPMV